MSGRMPDRDQVLAALRAVMDVEVGIDIVDLGLVYDVDIEPGRIGISMTTTSPACPTGSLMVEQARAAAAAIAPPEAAVEVVLVRDPPWDPGRLSESARKRLGC